jgi:hypothetical protein
VTEGDVALVIEGQHGAGLNRYAGPEHTPRAQPRIDEADRLMPLRMARRRGLNFTLKGRLRQPRADRKW